MKLPSCLVCAAVALFVFAGCSRRPSGAAVGPVSTSGAPAVATPQASADQRVTGTVLETMNASSYTYVRVKTESGELWAAAPQFKTAVGERVLVSLEQPMENFHSQSLNRDFPRIYFVSQMATGAGATAPSMATSHLSPAAQDPPTSATVMPAAGGMTVEAIWKSRDSLAGKTVTVRGKVVKFNGGILGVNWIHLQDGTGSAADGSNDITVTSEDEAKVGDTITVTGSITLNRDLGSGYNYPVIIEHARIAPQREAR